MKYPIALGLAIGLSSLSSAIHAEVKPYIGLSAQYFTINAEGISASGNGQSFSDDSDTSDSGSTVGIDVGFIIGPNGRVELSRYSGEENDSELLTATVTSLVYKHSADATGKHRGWYIGGGIAHVDIEADDTEFNRSGSDSAVGLTLRAGYEYLADNGLLMDVGVNYNTAEVDLELDGQGQLAGVTLEAETRTSNINFSISYAF